MIKTEKQLWQRLKKAYPDNSQIKMTRIETSTENGVPDICYTDGKINGWIELKVPKLPDYIPTNQTVFSYLNLTPVQIMWLSSHAMSFVLVFFYEHYLILNANILLKMINNTWLPFHMLAEKQGIHYQDFNSEYDTLKNYLNPFLTGEKQVCEKLNYV